MEKKKKRSILGQMFIHEFFVKFAGYEEVLLYHHGLRTFCWRCRNNELYPKDHRTFRPHRTRLTCFGARMVAVGAPILMVLLVCLILVAYAT